MSTTLTTRVVDGDSPSFELDAAELRVVAGPDRGLKLALTPGSTLIGSASDCDLVLHDSSVSSRHAEITAGPSGYLLRDLRSTNGVVLAGYRVDRLPLAHGMRLAFGETSIVVHGRDEKLSVPLDRPGQLGALIAHSVKMRALVATLRQLAMGDATLLLEGETGTGKELVAETLHGLGSRRLAPFVVFDCGGINRSLMAAQLFGYERGAFTGAEETVPGVFEQADGGTLFLDEVGEIPLDLQPLLLGAIERKSTRRIGGARDIASDVRIVAATRRNLAEEMRAGRIRADLFYRLAVIRLRVPPLRERLEDLPMLADRFAREAGTTLSLELVTPLKAYDWPGNVRELRNTIQRIAVVPNWRPEDAVPRPRPLRPLREARRLAIDDFERAYLEQVLAAAEGNLSRAAELSGIARQSLTELAIKHNLHPRGGS